MAKEREEWWAKQLERERERQSVWEESLATVVKEGEVLERELRTRSRRRGSRFFDASVGSGTVDGMGTLGLRPSKLAASKSSSVPEEVTTPAYVAVFSGSPPPLSELSRRTSVTVPSSARTLTHENIPLPPIAGDWDRGMDKTDNDLDTETNRLSVESATTRIGRDRPGSVMSTTSSLRPMSTASSTSRGSFGSSVASVRDEELSRRRG